ncbi:MAG: ferrous iron transport protein B [Opitutales bacterium]|jgi:ferrous iron transport protein B|nr:ferrous iron transport protein B [Opitutales bacterium]MDP4643075.1 ferrous iron transport protein B [Opitutales bacterium]MDP4776779.1 ferrous iron transport protein B [Opitutales bacterium]MDP4882874.1 ferrous iron transport protein B [Opitutales bacterium]MDP5080417.1 ferrous iron transport protein B [Opitutales bacterium]
MSTAEKRIRIAVIGNPNTGKTSLFNTLTGLRQRVGNYSGVTVEKKTGIWNMPHGQDVELIDLPGTYSLSATSLDERVAVDVIAGHEADSKAPDLVIVVVDVENLRRNLFLASQASELGVPMVIALNCWDVAEKKGLQIDSKLLQQRLGVPVIPTVAKRKSGTDELAKAVERAIETRPMMARPYWPDPVKKALTTLKDELVVKRGESLREGELQRLIFDRKSAVRERLKTPASEHEPIIKAVRDQLYKDGFQPDAAESTLRFRFLNPLLNDVLERQAALKKRSKSESIDQLLLHKFWGLLVFIGMMYVVFQSVYTWAGPLMDLIEGGVGWVQGIASDALVSMPMLQSLIADGIIGGVGAFLVFLPQILVLFFFISLLEASGYMARAAFLMDKLFQWCGLNGKSFVPLLTSFACAIPGIMATRTINDNKARLITILIAPLMSCSARLPVYLLLIGAFIEPQYGPKVAGATLFAMHFIGALVAAPFAWALNKTVNKGRKPIPFVMELPHYRVPQIKLTLHRMYESGKEFVVRAGTVIFAMTIVIWALLYFPRSAEVENEIRAKYGITNDTISVSNVGEQIIANDLEEAISKQIDAAYLEQSYMGRFGKFVQPVFAPAGYDWKITVGVLASFPAREIIISTLGITYALGGEVDEESGDLRSTLSNAKWESGPRMGEPVFNIPVALSIMVFFALCMQCGATLAVIAKELNWWWATGSFFALTSIAWIAAVLVYQIGMLF